MAPKLFPKISNKWGVYLHWLERAYNPYPSEPLTLELIGTVKLHGTHADIVVDPHDGIRLRSRHRDGVTVDNDIFGFAAWANTATDAILDVKRRLFVRSREMYPRRVVGELPVVMAGEWIGEGIQAGVGIDQLPRSWVLFNISFDGGLRWERIEEYGDIEAGGSRIYNVMRGGTFRDSLTLGTHKLDRKRMQEATEQVERQCPFARSFGIVGGGEGIVWKVIGREYDAGMWLKTKGPKFWCPATTSQGNSMPVRVESDDEDEPGSSKKTSTSSAIKKFVRKVVTEERLKQGWSWMIEMGHPHSAQGLDKFLEWLRYDVFVEEKWEIASKHWSKKRVEKAIHDVGRQWFVEAIDAEEKSLTAVDDAEPAIDDAELVVDGAEPAV